MRPTLKVLDDDLIARILEEAKRVLAEVGMEIRGATMRQRLVDAGLPTTADGRVLFPREVVERASGRCALCGEPAADTAFRRWEADDLLAAHTSCVVGLGPPARLRNAA